MSGFRAGFVTILGKPNVGKSTLLNAILREKVAIISSKPQTTRDRLSGIYSDEQRQIVFVDTPGVIEPKDRFNERLVSQAREAIEGVDVVLHMVDFDDPRPLPPEMTAILTRAKAPLFLVVNKIDRAKPPFDWERWENAIGSSAGVLFSSSSSSSSSSSFSPSAPNRMDAMDGMDEVDKVDGVDEVDVSSPFDPLRVAPRRVSASVSPSSSSSSSSSIAASAASAPLYAARFAVSALLRQGVDELIEAVSARLPEGAPFYDTEQLCDRDMRYLAAERVREKVFELTRQEIPYSVATQTEEFHERDGGKPFISVAIFVERDSQKGVLVGRNGAMIKEVGQAARREIEELMGQPVFLELHVKVRKNWRASETDLREFGYGPTAKKGKR